MKLTAKSHYSVKALLDLSLQPHYGPASVKAIAQRQDLPAPYLEKLLMEMRRAGLVVSLRGVQGGYQLARPPQEISLAQILGAIGEELESFPDLEADAADTADWVTRALWRQLQQKFQQVFQTVTLADLYYDARSWQASQGQESSFMV